MFSENDIWQGTHAFESPKRQSQRVFVTTRKKEKKMKVGMIRSEGFKDDVKHSMHKKHELQKSQESSSYYIDFFKSEVKFGQLKHTYIP